MRVKYSENHATFDVYFSSKITYFKTVLYGNFGEITCGVNFESQNLRYFIKIQEFIRNLSVSIIFVNFT